MSLIILYDNFANSNIVYIIRCNATLRCPIIFASNSASFTVVNSDIVIHESSKFIDNGEIAKSSMDFKEGGAITIIQSTMLIYGEATIEHNWSASSGGGIYAIESIVKVFNDVCINHNTANFSGGGVYLFSSVLICESTCTISMNTALNEPGLGGGIHAIRSSIVVSDPSVYDVSDDDFDKREGLIVIVYVYKLNSLIIADNTALQGGGFNLEENSKLYIQGDRNRCFFSGNRALRHGGAIFINDSTTASVCTSDTFSTISVKTECFLQKFYHVDEAYTAIVAKRNGGFNFSINFTNNSAIVGGSILFGGLLDRCTISPLYYKEYVEDGKIINHISGVEYFTNLTSIDYEEYVEDGKIINHISGLEYFTNLTSIDYEDINTTISSQPVRICFCESDTSQHNCSYYPQAYHVMKGEEFNVALVAVDQVGHSIEANISSLVSQDGDLGEGQAVRKTSKQCQNFTFSVKSSRPYNEELTIYAEGPCYSLGMSKSVVKVIFKDCMCPRGFEPADNTTRKCSCVCAKEIESYVTCNYYPNRTTIIQRKLWHNAWIGICDENFTTILSNESCYLTHPNCPFDYCNPPNNDYIDLNSIEGLNSQCALNHSGLLCGSCKQGLSLSVGSSRCIKCPKSWPGLVVANIVYVLLASLVMVTAIAALDLTVARGTINGLLFYANVVGSNSTLLLKFKTPNILTVFLSVLNFTYGFDLCFIEGMNAILKTWLGLLASGYVFALIFFLIHFTKYSTRFARFFGKGNPVATLATLMLLFYAKLLRYIINVFSFAVVKYPNGSRLIVWRPDASVKYLSSVHIPLFLIGLLIIVLGFAYTVLLFSWQWLLQLSKFKIFKWLRNSRLNFFMEANLAPYKPKYRFWTGLLLFVRILLYLASALNVTNSTQLHLLAVGVCVTSIIVLKAYIGNTIYKNSVLDYLDLTFYFNIVLLIIATSYYTGKTKMQSIAAAISISIALIMFLCTLIYHIVLTLQNRKWAKKLKTRIEGCCEKKRRGEGRDGLLYLNIPQGIEMNSVDVATPTSSVVSLSPLSQDDVNAQNEEYEDKERQIQCYVESDQVLSKDDSLQEEQSTARTPFHYGYKNNTLQKPLL